ncbi:GIY-YIG nuclease family protein [Ruegeria sp. MALMAid1280]|uniref:GIY-YIG nuclease family protein n=1 Tax=Ruegeria sp. MALMAid1280 TaxID=3411634 RepID=UPI003BA09B26
MTTTPVIEQHSEIIRAMRPYQRKAADLIIADVVAGHSPCSVHEAQARYRDQLGEAIWIDNGKGWEGDIRDTSIYCLIKNGFAKAKTVKLCRETGLLTEWSSDRDRLTAAAKLEYEHGGNLRQTQLRERMLEDCKVFGQGKQAVYLYTDNLLEDLGFKCTKIGRHLSNELGSVADRVLSQYGTGSAGYPVLRYIVRTNDSVALETSLHRSFNKLRLKGAVGTEWFRADVEEVVEEARKLTSS